MRRMSGSETHLVVAEDHVHAPVQRDAPQA
jgi:hypothetical protein